MLIQKTDESPTQKKRSLKNYYKDQKIIKKTLHFHRGITQKCGQKSICQASQAICLAVHPLTKEKSITVTTATDMGTAKYNYTPKPLLHVHAF
jgi:hypothetical protein